ncbi:MAG: poly-beta-1,6-N-acetyl-D-glucosamine biosynthesis protein PgaD [Gammaproteobacteria bacterium]
MSEQMTDTTILAPKDLISRRYRARDALLTTALWVLYAYFWLPLISLLAWLAGIDFAYDLVIEAGGPENLIVLLLWFLIMLLIIAAIVTGWSGIQYSRFANRERRSAAPPTPADEQMAIWNIDQKLFDELQSAHQITVNMDHDGQITDVREGPNAVAALD